MITLPSIKFKTMLSNYTKSAWRNIKRSPASSLINIFGLSFSIAIFILIALFINNEYSMDKFIAKRDRIVRLEFGEWAFMGPGMRNLIAEKIPNIEDAVSISPYGLSNRQFYIDEQMYRIDNVVVSSSNLFSVINLNLIQGSANEVLSDPYSIVLSESTAKRLFGNENPVGKTINLDKWNDLTVTGVFKDENRFHLNIDAVVPENILPSYYNNPTFFTSIFSNMNHLVYIVLNSNADIMEVYNKINLECLKGEEPDPTFMLNLRPLNEIYLSQGVKFEGPVKHGNPRFINIMLIIAALIIVTAVINYINLSTAQATRRAKEIGVRKVCGSSKLLIVKQFLGESVLLVAISGLISLAIVELIIPLFNTLVERKLSLGLLENPHIMLYLLAGSIILGIAAGFYPALFLSKYNPSLILKGGATKGKSKAFMRKGLIIFQFAVSVALIAGTLIILNQIDYIVSYKPGFDKEQILNLPLDRSIRSNFNSFRERLESLPSVESAALSNGKPGSIMWQESWTDNGTSKNFAFIPVSSSYIKTLGLTIVKGRDFSQNSEADINTGYIINETMANELGFDDPIGKVIPSSGYWKNSRVIIGVVKDFNFNSLHTTIAPLAMNLRNQSFQHINIRIKPNQTSEAIQQIETVWNDFTGNAAYEYSFLDQEFDKNYKEEQSLAMLFGYFAFIAIFISSLGLYGLSMFMLRTRVREIGIRKVLGAGTFGIIEMLSREFALLVIVANIIAWPIIWYAMEKWLSTFPYHIKINPLILVASGVISLIIALATTWLQSYKAAQTNPAETVRVQD